MTDTTSRTRTITLTDQPPVSIREDQWPVIATGSADADDSSQPGNPPNREWTRTIRVRQHEDGRVIVYGVYDYSTCYQGARGAAARRGEMLARSTSAEVIAAIRAVGADLAAAETAAAIDPDHKDPRRWGEVAQECIADLPAVEI